jgi:DNA polymerase-4
MKGGWFHVDLDAFFASVEQLDDPSLRGKPVVVGARPGGRGVVSTCSYEARAFGIHSAMPIGEAYRRCPDGIYLPPRMERYAEMSTRVMTILADFSPDVRRISIDEAFLDMNGMGLLLGDSERAAVRLKARVRDETGLGISVGLASNRYVAKIASGLRKPDGLVVVPAGEEAAFMRGLPLSRLWGAGEKTQDRFRDLGILSMPDLADRSEAELVRLFGEAGGRFIHAAARGGDLPLFEGQASSRSMSTETTFERDVVDSEILESSLLEMAISLQYRLWHEGYSTRTLALKLRLFDFSTLSRRSSRRSDYRDSGEVFDDARILLSRAWNGRSPVRLIGLAFVELAERCGPLQAELFAGDDRRGRLEEAIFGLERQGIAAPKPARLLGSGRVHDQRRPTGTPGLHGKARGQ